METLSGVKILPFKGPANAILSKSKFESFFDAVFVSCRASQTMNEDYFPKILKERALVAAETAKFFIPLPTTDKKKIFLEKVDSFAAKQGLRCIPAPVPRRRRDELDLEDDVAFYVR